MKVSELIDKLKTVDQDAIVFSTDSEFDNYEINIDVAEIIDIHLENHNIFDCTGDNCYYCKRNYPKAKGLRLGG